MKKLIILFIGLIFSISGYTAIKCEEKLDQVIQYRTSKLHKPNYIQVIKNKTEDENIPIIKGGDQVYTTNNSIDAFRDITNVDILGKLFKSDVVEIKHTLYQSNYFIIYPIKDMKRRYITGFLILGYKEIIQNDDLAISLELVETYLSQILDLCEE
nr:MAG TPA: hypothetical protein [Caudoviricetes sp.]